MPRCGEHTFDTEKPPTFRPRALRNARSECRADLLALSGQWAPRLAGPSDPAADQTGQVERKEGVLVTPGDESGCGGAIRVRAERVGLDLGRGESAALAGGEVRVRHTHSVPDRANVCQPLGEVA